MTSKVAVYYQAFQYFLMGLSEVLFIVTGKYYNIHSNFYILLLALYCYIMYAMPLYTLVVI